MMRKEAKIGVLLVFAVFLWYLLAQYSSVYIYYDDYGYLSFFGRGEYNYDNRYYADFSVRTDASSRFGADRRRDSGL